MSTNEVLNKALRMAVVCSDPASPASGDPVVFGQRPGVALVSKLTDGSNLTSVQFDGMHLLSVKGVTTAAAASAVVEGDIIYYVPGNTPKLSKAVGDAGAVRFGYAGPGGAVNASATATIPVIIGY